MTASFSPDRLRGHRDGLGLPTETAAGLAGCTVQEWLDYECGRAEPAAALVPKLAEAVGVPVAELRPHFSTDRVRDYVSAVTMHSPELTDDDLVAVATLLRSARGRASNRSGASTS